MDNYGRSRKLSQKTRMIPAIICITMIMAVLLEWHLGVVWIHFFVTQFSSLITHHLKYHVCLAPSLTSHHSIFFTLFVGPIPVTGAAFSFFFSIPKLTESSEKKKKKRTDRTSEKKKKRTEQPIQENKKRIEQPTQKKNKKKKKNSQPKKRKKKVKRWSKVAAVGPYVCLITILSLSYGNWKQPKCVFSFHNS